MKIDEKINVHYDVYCNYNKLALRSKWNYVAYIKYLFIQ